METFSGWRHAARKCLFPKYFVVVFENHPLLVFHQKLTWKSSFHCHRHPRRWINRNNILRRCLLSLSIQQRGTRSLSTSSEILSQRCGIKVEDLRWERIKIINFNCCYLSALGLQVNSFRLPQLLNFCVLGRRQKETLVVELMCYCNWQR